MPREIINIDVHILGNSVVFIIIIVVVIGALRYKIIIQYNMCVIINSAALAFKFLNKESQNIHFKKGDHHMVLRSCVRRGSY